MSEETLFGTSPKISSPIDDIKPKNHDNVINFSLHPLSFKYMKMYKWIKIIRGHIIKTPVLNTVETITGVVSPGVGNQLMNKLKAGFIATNKITEIKVKVKDIIEVIKIR